MKFCSQLFLLAVWTVSVAKPLSIYTKCSPTFESSGGRFWFVKMPAANFHGNVQAQRQESVEV